MLLSFFLSEESNKRSATSRTPACCAWSHFSGTPRIGSDFLPRENPAEGRWDTAQLAIQASLNLLMDTAARSGSQYLDEAWDILEEPGGCAGTCPRLQTPLKTWSTQFG